MNVKSLENDYKNGVLVQLDKYDIAVIKEEMKIARPIDRFLYSTIFAIAEWIIRELEE